MLFSYEEYSELGYSSIPTDSFERWEAKAELTAQKYTMGRLNASMLTDNGKRGLCELAELLYKQETGTRALGEVASFSNGRYSESYAAARAKSIEERMLDILTLYFPPNLTCRWL